MDLDLIVELVKPAETKIIFLVMDGLGGLSTEIGGLTELETARTPNLDQLAAEGICGLQQPVGPGITPGSGPSHLALFGYDPIKYQVGRGVLSALGIDFNLQPGDIAARGNFCTVDGRGIVVDRRAGRISTDKNGELCAILRQIKLSGAELFVEPEREHRFLFVLRGRGLQPDIDDTDPQGVGRTPLPPEPKAQGAEQTSRLVSDFLAQAGKLLARQHPANMVLLRGFSTRPHLPSFNVSFGLNAGAIAAYPMYRGLAKLIGMEILDTGENVQDEFDVLQKHWSKFDFFYLHVKKIDSAGEDGDLEQKVALIEEVDSLVPRLLELKPDVIVVTGDHSTPAALMAHSWHPVPVVLWSKYCRADGVRSFGERACLAGGLGPNFPAVGLIPLALANALRLEKYGA